MLPCYSGRPAARRASLRGTAIAGTGSVAAHHSAILKPGKVAEGTVDPTTAKWEANAHAHRSAVDRPVTALPRRWLIRPEGPESTRDRDRGMPRGIAPPTPPGIRVRSDGPWARPRSWVAKPIRSEMPNRTPWLREAANDRALRARTWRGLAICQYRAMGSVLAWRFVFCWKRRS